MRRPQGEGDSVGRLAESGADLHAIAAPSSRHETRRGEQCAADGLSTRAPCAVGKNQQPMWSMAMTESPATGADWPLPPGLGGPIDSPRLGIRDGGCRWRPGPRPPSALETRAKASPAGVCPAIGFRCCGHARKNCQKEAARPSGIAEDGVHIKRSDRSALSIAPHRDSADLDPQG